MQPSYFFWARLGYSVPLFVLALLGSHTAHAAPWVTNSPLNVARHSHTATLLPNGNVLVAGGGILSNVITNSAELYDPATGKCQPTGFMLEARRNATATLLPNGKVLIAGGFNFNEQHLASAELYDPATG